MKFRVLSVDAEKKVLELTLKDLLIRGKKKMPMNFDEVEHGKKFAGVIVGQNHNSYIVKFYNELKGFLRFDEVQKHPQKLILTEGTIVDVFILFQTQAGLALTLSQQDSINAKAKAKEMEMSKNCSLEKLIQMENDSLIDEIKKSNNGKTAPVGKISTVHCVTKGRNGLRVRSIEEPKFEAYLPFDLVSHSKQFQNSIQNKLEN